MRITEDANVDVIFSPMLRLAADTDSTFEPYENICPITGTTNVTISKKGKNLLNNTTFTEGYYADNGTPTTSASVPTRMIETYIPCEANINYEITFTYASDAEAGRVRIHEYDINRNWLRQLKKTGAIPLSQETNKISWTASPDAAYFRFSLGLFDTIECYDHIEEYLIDFSTTAGTVYGGTLNISEDGSGQLIIDKSKLLCNGTETWTVTTSTHHIFTRTGIPNPKPDLTKIWDENHSTALKILYTNGITPSWYQFSNMRATAPSVCLRANGGVYLCIEESNNYATAEQAIAWITEHPFEIVYYIEPITYDLTPLQVIKLFNGENNIWTDTNNNIDLTYKTRFTIITPEERNKLNNIPASAVPNYFGVCSDSDVTRTVTVDSSFTLAEGAMINVFFENASTSQATLNVNNTGAYPIYIYGSQTVTDSLAWGWRAGQLVELVFHDLKWYVQNQYFSNAGTTSAGLMTSSHVTKLSSLDPNSTTPIQLTNQDLDDIHPTNTTWYYAGGGNTVENKPSSNFTSFGMVCFRTAGGYITQLFWPTGWSYHYCRTWNGTSWSEWVCIGREASSSENGLMSVTDKNNLDGIVGTQLTNEDLNDIHPGHFAVYWADSDNTCTHKPTAISVYAFALICMKTTSVYQLQVLFHPTSNRQWRRYWNGSSWSSWGEITYSWAAARTYNGLMSAADKIKLDDLKASTINVTDTYGLCGTTGATVTIQALMDAIANKV